MMLTVSCDDRSTSKPANAYVLTRFDTLSHEEQELTPQQGNQIGAAFWQNISGEHGLDGAGVYVDSNTTRENGH